MTSSENSDDRPICDDCGEYIDECECEAADRRAHHSLVLPFDRPEASFAHGVEIGRLYEMMRRVPERFEQTLHTQNAEMAIRCAEATGRAYTSVELGSDEWLVLVVESR